MYIDLKPLVQRIESSIVKVGQVTPTLAILKYGDRADSKAYIRSIEKKARELGVKVIIQDLEGVKYPGEKIIEIQKLAYAVLPINPLPENMERIVSLWLDGKKDIDNFTGRSMFQNCTGEAVLEILKYLGIGTEKKVTIIGRHIGLDIFKVLLNADYSPTICHRKTRYLPCYTVEADVVISATGTRNLIDMGMVREDSLVIDVGLGDVAGDVVEVADVTPIKNGVGAVTTAVLFKHIFETVK